MTKSCFHGSKYLFNIGYQDEYNKIARVFFGRFPDLPTGLALQIPNLSSALLPTDIASVLSPLVHSYCDAERSVESA